MIYETIQLFFSFSSTIVTSNQSDCTIGIVAMSTDNAISLKLVRT